MKKMININERLVKKLQQEAINQGGTQSGIVETALNLYFLLLRGEKGLTLNDCEPQKNNKQQRV
jgi:hypothetical protein